MGFVSEQARQDAESAAQLKCQAIHAEVIRRTGSLEPHIPYLVSRLEEDVARRLLKGPVSSATIAFNLDINGRIRDPRDYAIWRAFSFKRKDRRREYMSSSDNRNAVSEAVAEFLIKKLKSYEDKVSSIEFEVFASGPGNSYLTSFMEVHFSPALT